MSKSYGNAIYLQDSKDQIRQKVKSMVTDPSRIRVEDPGHPEACNVYSYYKIFSGESQVSQVTDWCTQAKKGCVECKSTLADVLIEKLAQAA